MKICVQVKFFVDFIINNVILSIPVSIKVRTVQISHKDIQVETSRLFTVCKGSNIIKQFFFENKSVLIRYSIKEHTVEVLIKNKVEKKKKKVKMKLLGAIVGLALLVAVTNATLLKCKFKFYLIKLFVNWAFVVQ